MSTWKRKDESDRSLFQFLCSECDLRKRIYLEREGWILLREDEPVCCNDCELQCALTTGELWGAGDGERFAVCAECAGYERCALKGRYFC